MYKRLFILLFLIGIAAGLQAQITMSLQVAPTGVVQKTQLWNMVLVNTSSTPVAVYVNLSLLSVRDNRPLMTAVTRFIVLNKGAKQLTAADISPVSYNYISAAFNIDRSPDGFLPFGNYKACYSVYKTDNEGIVPLAEDCILIEVQPLSPPILNTPADADTIETVYPQFTWLPAVPLNLFSNLNYDMLLVEVLPGQTKEDAIQKNMPVYNSSYVKNPFVNYPASGKSLDTGRVYAWKVVAKNEDEPVAQTEIWTFKISDKIKPPMDFQNSHYVLLHDDLQGIYKVTNDTLHVKYFSFDKAHTGAVLFTDEAGQVVYQENKQIIQGDNYLDFRISSRLQTDKVYLVRITGLDGKKHIARFSIPNNQ